MFISYALKIELLKDKSIKIGKLAKINFKKGTYVYVGSAKKNIDKRIERHLRKEKNMHWHIDYFLKHSKIVNVKKYKIEECNLANKFKKCDSIINFGCSDCKCKSHLFKLK